MQLPSPLALLAGVVDATAALHASDGGCCGASQAGSLTRIPIATYVNSQSADRHSVRSKARLLLAMAAHVNLLSGCLHMPSMSMHSEAGGP